MGSVRSRLFAVAIALFVLVVGFVIMMAFFQDPPRPVDREAARAVRSCLARAGLDIEVDDGRFTISDELVVEHFGPLLECVGEQAVSGGGIRLDCRPAGAEKSAVDCTWTTDR